MTKIKIFVAYKEKTPIIKSDIIQPIQTGRAIADEKFEDMIGDDTGDNISKLNDKVCEFSAIYWVWKHYEEIGNPEYIGFMHNRRHFIFNNRNYVNFYNIGEIPFKEIDKNYLSECLNDKKILKFINKKDIILPYLCKVPINIYKQYAENHNSKDYDIAIEYIKNINPEFSKFLEEYNNQGYGYFCNIFIVKKEIFFEYCNFIFGVLFDIKNKIDTTDYDKYQTRVLGFIAERLTGAFFYSLQKQKKYKIRHLNISIINDTTNVNPDNNTNIKWYEKIFSVKEYIAYMEIYILGIKIRKHYIKPNDSN